MKIDGKKELLWDSWKLRKDRIEWDLDGAGLTVQLALSDVVTSDISHLFRDDDPAVDPAPTGIEWD